MVVAIVAMLASPSISAQRSHLDPALQRRIDSVFSAYATDSTPGYALGVIRNGRLIVCLSHMPAGDAEGHAKAVLEILLDSARVNTHAHPL
jgi:CubicO group peptidase (beta-lactamase class C family)